MPNDAEVDPDAQRGQELRDLGRAWPTLGHGASTCGRWELRGELSQDDPQDLYLYLEVQSPDGRRVGGGGTGPAELALASTALRVILSVRAGVGPIHYVGQVVPTADRVEVEYEDGTRGGAGILSTHLPVKLWVAVATGPALITAARVLDADNALLEDVGPFPIHRHEPNSSATWA